MDSSIYDSEANTMYFRFTKERKPVAITLPLREDRFMDLDKDGTPIGFEIIFPKYSKEFKIKDSNTHS